MKKYKALDRAIMNKMGGHPQKFLQINVRDVSDEAHRIAESPGEAAPSFRIVDRRLQALRKQGLIQASSKGWILTPARKEQSC